MEIGTPQATLVSSSRGRYLPWRASSNLFQPDADTTYPLLSTMAWAFAAWAARGQSHTGRPAVAGLALAAASQTIDGGRASEAFNLRQPEHVILAGELGLGVFPREQIRHQVIKLQ